jgi:Zn-dependent alcohol dehydrogenase
VEDKKKKHSSVAVQHKKPLSIEELLKKKKHADELASKVGSSGLCSMHIILTLIIVTA